REVCVRPGYDGLGHLEGATTAAVTELLLRTRDVYGTDDPPDTPVEQRRTGGQRFHDALRDALTVALDRHPGSVVGGVKTHVVVFADLMTLLGRDDLARIRPRLSQTGVIDPETARHLIATTDHGKRGMCRRTWLWSGTVGTRKSRSAAVAATSGPGAAHHRTAFQAGNAGSIPVTRSSCLSHLAQPSRRR
ncbi:MAG: hypothetical protein M3415_00280, partial [Actinomycetota bacterium]|nr:hypothetical protein [Actinomycetota bacterium]